MAGSNDNGKSIYLRVGKRKTATCSRLRDIRMERKNLYLVAKHVATRYCFNFSMRSSIYNGCFKKLDIKAAIVAPIIANTLILHAKGKS